VRPHPLAQQHLNPGAQRTQHVSTWTLLTVSPRRLAALAPKEKRIRRFGSKHGSFSSARGSPRTPKAPTAPVTAAAPQSQLAASAGMRSPGHPGAEHLPSALAIEPEELPNHLLWGSGGTTRNLFAAQQAHPHLGSSPRVGSRVLAPFPAPAETVQTPGAVGRPLANDCMTSTPCSTCRCVRPPLLSGRRKRAAPFRSAGGHARILLITLLAKVSDALRCLDALVQV
jgi:hypothetical protein